VLSGDSGDNWLTTLTGRAFARALSRRGRAKSGNLPIEQAFAKLKALLRKAAARTIDALWGAIAAALDAFTTQECANYFTNSGYEPD
jgi:hypothetical protein